MRIRSGAISFRRAARSVPTKGSFRVLRMTMSAARAIELRQERPARRARHEIVFRAAAMLHENHHAGPFADICSEPVDALDDAAQIVLRLAVEEPDLHIDDDQ